MARRPDSDVQRLCKEGAVWIGDCRVYLRGEKYHLYSRAAGRTVRKSLGTSDPDVAVDVARKFNVSAGVTSRSAVLHGLADALKGTSSMSLNRLMAEHADSMKSAGASPAHLKWLACYQRYVSDIIGALRLDQITARDIERCIRIKHDEGKPAAADSAHRYLRQLCRYAQERGFLYKNPTQAVKRRQRPRQIPVEFQGLPQRAQYLTPAQVAAYRAAFEGTLLEGAFLLGIYAGLRRGEIVNLDWSRMNLRGKRPTITIAATPDWTPKAASLRTIPMHPEIKAWADWQKPRTGLVCTSPNGRRWIGENMRRYADRVIDRHNEHGKKADPKPKPLLHCGFHVWRHTFGVSCAGQGIPLTTIQHWMGHSSIRTTELYAHFAEQYAREGIERLSY